MSKNEENPYLVRPLLTVKDICEVLGCGRTYVQSLFVSTDPVKNLPSVLLGNKRKVRPKEFHEWLERNTDRAIDQLEAAEAAA